MPTVQLLLSDTGYAQALEDLLVREGYAVVHAAAPDFTGGEDIVVADRAAIERFPQFLDNPAQLVLIAANDPHFLATLWEHGVRSVVFDSDPPSTTLLAILALDLRHPEDREPDQSPTFGYGHSHPPAGRIHAGSKEWKII